MEDYSEFVPRVHFEQIPIKNLVSNQNYQRNLSQNHIVKAAEHFDLYQINPVKVSRRNGINYVFNGQHTIEIIALVSGSRETPVWCMIYDDLCYEHEADIFANQMKYVKTLQPLEVFAANIEAGNHDQLMIKELVESYGLAIGNKKRNGMISAVSTLESIYYKYGIHVLSRVLRLCIGTWEGEANSLSSNMLNAIAKLIVTYNGILNDEIFKERVGAVPPKIISRTAKERRPGSLGYAEAIIIAYNGKRKSSHGKLFINKLYEKDFSIIDEDEDYIADESCDSGNTDKNL
ncbi:MAG: DUF6551 family protein [Candidatus Ornithomonoglobus sp.]